MDDPVTHGDKQVVVAWTQLGNVHGDQTRVVAVRFLHEDRCDLLLDLRQQDVRLLDRDAEGRTTCASKPRWKRILCKQDRSRDPFFFHRSLVQRNIHDCVVSRHDFDRFRRVPGQQQPEDERLVDVPRGGGQQIVSSIDTVDEDAVVGAPERILIDG